MEIDRYLLEKNEFVLRSTNNRLQFGLRQVDIEMYDVLGPADQALSDYVKYQYAAPPLDNRYYLVADFEFYLNQDTDHYPINITIDYPDHFKRTSRWRLVLAREEPYTFHDQHFTRLIVTREIKSFDQPTPPDSSGTTLNNSIIKYKYRNWYLQTFHLQQTGCFGDAYIRDELRIKITDKKEVSGKNFVPMELIRKLQALSDSNPEHPVEERFWIWNYSWNSYRPNAPYTLTADFLFLYGESNWANYPQRKSDWKLVRETFEGEDYIHKFWTEDDGSTLPTEKLHGKWTCQNLRFHTEKIVEIEFLSDGSCLCTLDSGMQGTRFYALEQNRLRIYDRSEYGETFGYVYFNTTWNAALCDENCLLIRVGQ